MRKANYLNRSEYQN